MNKSVLIIQCPPVWLKTAPLSLIYLRTYLKNQGIDVRIIDLNMAVFQALRLDKEAWLPLNKEFEADLFDHCLKQIPFLLDFLYQQLNLSDIVGLSVFKRSWPFALKLAQNIKQRYPKKEIVFGGPETFFLDENNQLDTNYKWIIGEGEIPLAALALGANETVFRFQEINELDQLPFFDLTNLNPKAYGSTLPLLSSRGCAFSCNFCSEKLLTKKNRRHSAAYIVELIKYLNQTYQLNNFVFCDSLINSSTKWLEDFSRQLLKPNLPIKWEAQFRINKNFPKQTAELMRAAGCYNLFIGLESGSNNVLTAMNKGFSINDALACFKTLNQANLHFEISLITGYPNESDADFQETMKFIKDNKTLIPKIAQVNPFINYCQDINLDFDQRIGQRRANQLLNLFQKEKIRYTKNYINNLLYKI